MQADSRAGRFAWREWEGNAVVFDRRFGDTHTLSGPTAAVFRAWLLTESLEPGTLAQEPADIAAALLELQQRGLLPPP